MASTHIKKFCVHEWLQCLVGCNQNIFSKNGQKVTTEQNCESESNANVAAREVVNGSDWEALYSAVRLIRIATTENNNNKSNCKGQMCTCFFPNKLLRWIYLCSVKRELVNNRGVNWVKFVHTVRSLIPIPVQCNAMQARR